ncbi:MAG: anti-sigma factor family protein [Caulobacteraceae bacterium]
MGITDQLLMAYVDGELAPDLAALILSRLETEPDLLARLEQHQQLRQQLSALYSPVMSEPLPPGLTELLTKERAGSATPWRIPVQASNLVGRLGGGWPILAAAAACLLGVGLSEMRHAGDTIARSGDGRMLAAGALARSLEHGLAADAPASGAKIMASFQDRAGRYCRVFQGSGRQDGVACKEGGRWQVIAMAASTAAPPAEGYRQASSALAPSVAAAVDDLQGAGALTPEQERLARTQQWQVRGKAGPKSS